MECILEEDLKEQLLMTPLTDNYSISFELMRRNKKLII